MNLDDGDDVYNWPWLYAVRPGEWNLTDAQAAKLRDYLLRGGFFMADDFWGTDQWEVFMASMRRVFPDRQPVELKNSDQIFHTIYDLNDRYRVEGAWGAYQGDGVTPYWRAIFDDKGRVMVAIVVNSDLGDSWEWADSPDLPGAVLRARHPHRAELHHLRDDALGRFRMFPQAAAIASWSRSSRAAARRTLVDPFSPQAPLTGTKAAGSSWTNARCCSGVSLTIPQAVSG